MPVKISTCLEKVHVNNFNDTYFQIYFTFKMKENIYFTIVGYRT